MDAGWMHIYLDGQYQKSKANTGNIIDQGATPVWIGFVPEKGGRSWNGGIDEVRIYSRALGPETVNKLYLSDSLPPVEASNPSPADGAAGVAADVTLSWWRGANAVMHDVYFGDDDQAVIDANISDPNVYQGSQAANTYKPGVLELDKTYYWRVDNVLADGNTVIAGDVWSFTVTGPVEPDSSNLVAWWSFDDGSGNTATEHINGINGTLASGDVNDANGPDWTTGKIGGALLFDSDANDYVVCGPDPNLDIHGSLTIAAWFYVDGYWNADPWDPIFYKPHYDPVEDKFSRAYRLGQNARHYDGLCFTLKAEEGGEVKVLKKGTGVVDGLWHHVAGTYDVDTGVVTLFVDGTPVRSGTTSGNIVDNAGQPLYIGAYPNVDKPFFSWNGGIDEAQIYNYALSHPEVAWIVSTP